MEEKIRASLGKGKTIIIYGARQVGKTTLLHTIFDDQDGVLWLNGDEDTTQMTFDTISVENFQSIVSGYKTVIIDEAQRIENIGLKLKVLHDNFSSKIQFIATGSSSFELANKVTEPLTGRKKSFFLAPLTINELTNANGKLSEQASLGNRLLFGSYPGVVLSNDDTKEALLELANDNLYKDVLKMGEIIKTDKLRKILQALAFQVGSQVSINEIASLVGLDNKTVDKYISLLEQAFIIFRVTSYSKNLRNELKASQKFFFYDCGIRNAIIDDFRPIDLRPDIGGLFENYVMSELKKKSPNESMYFWRTTDQQEVDFVTEKDAKINAIEIKFNPKKKVSFPKSFVEAYNPAETIAINNENYLNILTNS